MPEHILIQADPTDFGTIFVRCNVCKKRAVFRLPLCAETFLKGVIKFIEQHQLEQEKP
jgi:hypothetical protein